MKDPRSKVLISATELASVVDARAPIILLDVRDEPVLERKLIPGSIATSLATDFCGPSSREGGRRPLPNIDALEAITRHWGVTPEHLIVVYDDNAGAQAARAWWTLRWAGLENVRILDGGIQAWVQTGRSETTEPAIARGGGTVKLRAGCLPTISADEAALIAGRSRLFDARGRANYVGAPAEPGKPAVGHIPGALLAPSGEHVTDGCFKSSEDIRARLAALGIDGSKPVAVYCGSGNAASHLLAALHIVGLDAALYVGSFSHWSADPSRPVATGPTPG